MVSLSPPGDFDLQPLSPSSPSQDTAVIANNSKSNNDLLLVQGLTRLHEYGKATLWDVAKAVLLRLLSSAEPHPQPVRALHLNMRQSRSPPLSPHDDGPSSSPFPRRARAPRSSRHHHGPSSPPRPRIFPSTPSTPPRSRIRPSSPSSARPRISLPLSPENEPSSSPFPRTRSQISFPPRRHGPCSSTFPRTRVLLSPRYYEATSPPFPRPRTRSSAPTYPRNQYRQARTPPPLSPRNMVTPEDSLRQRRLTRSHSRIRDPSPLQIDVRQDPQHAVRFDQVVRVAYI